MLLMTKKVGRISFSKVAYNGSRLCEGKGLEALNFKLSTNDL